MNAGDGRDRERGQGGDQHGQAGIETLSLREPPEFIEQVPGAVKGAKIQHKIPERRQQQRTNAEQEEFNQHGPAQPAAVQAEQQQAGNTEALQQQQRGGRGQNQTAAG